MITMKRFGWTNPILIDNEDRVIAGHGRIAAEMPDRDKPAVTEPGALWIIGEHRIYCGDAPSRGLTSGCSAITRRRWSLRLDPDQARVACPVLGDKPGQVPIAET